MKEARRRRALRWPPGVQPRGRQTRRPGAPARPLSGVGNSVGSTAAAEGAAASVPAVGRGAARRQGEVRARSEPAPQSPRCTAQTSAGCGCGGSAMGRAIVQPGERGRARAAWLGKIVETKGGRASRRRSRDTKHRAPPKPARPSPNPPRALIMPQYCACRGAQGAHLNRSAAGRPVSGGPRAARSSPTIARRKHSGMLHAHGGRSGDEAAACAGGARAPRQSRSAPSPRRVGRCTARTNAAAAAAGARWESDCAAGRAWTREGVARKNRRNERLA